MCRATPVNSASSGNAGRSSASKARTTISGERASPRRCGPRRRPRGTAKTPPRGGRAWASWRPCSTRSGTIRDHLRPRLPRRHVGDERLRRRYRVGRGHRLGFGDLREPLEQRSRTHVHGALVILARAARVGVGAPGRQGQLAGLERAVGGVLLRGGEVRSGDGSWGNAACSLRPTAAGKLTARMPADAAYVEAKAEAKLLGG